MSNFVDAPNGYPLSDGYRISIYKEQGGRHHMEDIPVFARDRYDGVPDDVVTEPYDYIAIFDGHGGSQASEYASEHLLRDIVSQREFWSDNEAEILAAIRQGFINCHYKMWKASKEWPPSSPGIMCTAGTTASVAFVRGEKIYVGHVGDSGIALGRVNDFYTEARDKPLKTTPPKLKVQGRETDLTEAIFSNGKKNDPSKQESRFEALMLTRDHKPESPEEKERIESLNGEVRSKSGVFRVVWKRPLNSDFVFPDVILPVNPVPFLAVARSLGDFWSYEEEHNEFVVSPVPDVAVHAFSMPKNRCLIAGSDGLWNVVRPAECVEIVEETYRMQELWMWQCLKAGKRERIHGADVNVAELLVRKVLNRCELRKMRSDNVGIVVYYPCVSEEKILHVMENPAEGKMFPWFNDPDLGIAQYRYSLMHLQNMVSCINNNKSTLSIMEIACRIDMIGYAPRLRCNPLREQSRNPLDSRETTFDIDPFIPQCALVLTKENENLRIPAYDGLLLDEDLACNGSMRINPLKKRHSDILLSQRIKIFRTHSSQAIEASTTVERTELTTYTGYMNGSKRLRVAPAFEEEENVDSPPTFLSLSFSRDELNDLDKVANFQKDH
ncbi:protein phosphatase 1D-like [Paramacrobiotus metropolitanus]|uniref:protein phosphatase 1D-like n=1 Tax=Paramacrobiotus metropolitanus TaxID=2943436 RepID=UPI002445DEDD|nr:protein phosphatase 1D-like [Paramacrobiotus metropolitanus]XP_055329269.1 protein phosphatase 1D-like [Paramacrobiotus metropolitanus]XP_055329279.1 protein phosphatase 1D-like [Paramacrobiotus metropolitanus]